MRGIRESITRRTEDHLGEQPPHPATIAVLYLLCILLIWFLPGFLAPELFGGGATPIRSSSSNTAAYTCSRPFSSGAPRHFSLH